VSIFLFSFIWVITSYSNHYYVDTSYIALVKRIDSSIEEKRCYNYEQLVNYLMFNHYNDEKLLEVIDEYCSLCQLVREEMYCQYSGLRIERESRILEELPPLDRSDDWMKLIERFSSIEDNRLKSDILATYAVHLDYDLDRKTDAIRVYLRAVDLAKEVGQDYSNYTSYSSYANIGALKQEQDRWKEAIMYYKKAFKVFHHRERPINQIRLLKWISQAYAIGENLDSSLHYLNLAYDLTNEYQQHEKAKGIQEIQAKYDNEKLQRNIAEQDLLLSQRQLYTLGLGSLSLLLAGGWIFYRRRAQDSMSKERQQAQLDSINARLDGEEQERIRVAQVLHDGIASQLTAVDFQLSAMRAASAGSYDASIDRSVDLIRDTSSQVRELSHELVPPVLLKLGLIPALEDLCHKYSSELLNFSIISVPCDVELNIDRDKSFTLYLITQELLQNILKHSDASEVSIHHYTREDQLTIEITDNSSISLDDELSVDGSIGLISMRTRIESLGGTFKRIPIDNGTQNLQRIVLPYI